MGKIKIDIAERLDPIELYGEPIYLGLTVHPGRGRMIDIPEVPKEFDSQEELNAYIDHDVVTAYPRFPVAKTGSPIKWYLMLSGSHPLDSSQILDG